MHTRIIQFFWLSLILNAVLWIFLVPLWHFPDEQSHFAQVSFMAEKGHVPVWNEEKDLTYEIYKSEENLGTLRDSSGNNKFTFHPDYRIPYSSTGVVGSREGEIIGLARAPDRATMVKKEASSYPPLYYIPAALLYKLFYNADIFIRVFITRIYSVLLFLLNIIISYKFARLFFPKDSLKSLTFSLLVGFQPMFVFASVGVNSDALGNLVFSAFLYMSVKLLIGDWSNKAMFGLAATAIIAFFTKPQFIIVVFLAFMLSIYLSYKYKFKRKRHFWMIFLIAVLPAVAGIIYFFRNGPFFLITLFAQNFSLPSFVKFFREYTLVHTYREVLPWYWGIYDWLGVTYPRIIHRAINIVIALSGLGLLKTGYNCIFRKRKYDKKLIQPVIFLIITNLVYFMGISIFDWSNWYGSSYVLGVQGRYFFPLIYSHMLLLLVGWENIFPQRYRQTGVKILGIFMISLDIYAIYTVANTYYDISGIGIFITQASQYKPWFVKNTGIIAVISLFIVSLFIFLLDYVRYPGKNTAKNR